MNNIHLSSAAECYPIMGANFKLTSNFAKKNYIFLRANNNNSAPYKVSCPSTSNVNAATLNDHRNLHTLSSCQDERCMNHKIENDYPPDLPLPKKLPQSRHTAVDRLNSAAHIAPSHQNEPDASEGIQKIDIDEANINNTCAMIIKACLPGSNCSWVAKQHKIPRRYLYNWCPKIYGKSIKQMKEHLKLHINDKHNNSALSQLAAQLRSNRMSSFLNTR